MHSLLMLHGINLAAANYLPYTGCFVLTGGSQIVSIRAKDECIHLSLVRHVDHPVIGHLPYAGNSIFTSCGQISSIMAKYSGLHFALMRHAFDLSVPVH